MKKLFLLITIIMLLTGCSGNQTNSNPEPTQVPEGISIENDFFVLDKENTFQAMTFKYDSKMQLGGYENTFNLYYGSIDNPVFKILIVRFPNQSIDDVRNSISQDNIDIHDRMINDLNYMAFTIKGDNFYLHKHGDDTYSLSFSSEKDISLLEEEFMNRVTFN